MAGTKIEVPCPIMTEPHFPSALCQALLQAQRVVVLTGAGVSAESGVPTFREAQTGLWAKFKPEELATPEAFQRNPRLVWEWYAWRRQRVSQAAPNPAHHALAEMQRRVPAFTLVTQNVDGLHQRAGNRDVIEIHGNLLRTRCSVEQSLVKSWPPTDDVPPRCPRCGGRLRPDVVWFGESLPEDAWAKAVRAFEQSTLCFAVGTSAVVQPAASLPAMAKAAGAVLVEVNPTRTPLTVAADHLLPGPAGEILPALVRAVWG